MQSAPRQSAAQLGSPPGIRRPTAPRQDAPDDRLPSEYAPTWDQLLGSDGARDRSDAENQLPATSRRELRDREAGGRGRLRRNEETYGFPSVTPPKRKHRWVGWVVGPIVTIGIIGGGLVGAAYLLVPDWPAKLDEYFAPPPVIDYTGTGVDPVTIVIHDGDIGSDVAKTLVRSGVTMTFDSFYDLLLAKDEAPVFQPGAYTLKTQMSAQSALDALLDPANKLQNQVVIPEGESMSNALVSVSEGSGIPLVDLTAAAADYGSYGLPAGATSLEGFLFPATYIFDPGTTAHDALQIMVNRTLESLDTAGVAPEDRFRVITFASLVQREAGLRDDFYKVARVFQNRARSGHGAAVRRDGRLRHPATRIGSARRMRSALNEANLYNTYVHPGLPIGPISNPGDLAIDAVLHPADGPWLYFVTVNLETGETVFSETLDQHETAVDQWLGWMDEHPEYQ